MNKTVNGIILGILFIPLLYLSTLGLGTVFLKENGIEIFHLFTNIKLLNSLKLAFLVMLLSTFFSLFASLFYYQIKNKNVRHFFLLMLFFLFAIAPIIYTALLSGLRLFNTLNALTKSVTVLTLWLLPLASGIMILIMRNIDQSSLITAKFLPLSKFTIFKEVILKQSRLALLGISTLIFMMVFIQEEVPSFFGYRTYAEDFLSRIILMEKIESTIIYAWPFIVFALGTTAVLYFILKKNSWKLFQDHIAPLDKLTLFHSEKFSYISILLFSIIVLFIIFQLLSRVNFSIFATLFSDNSTILLNSFLLSASGAFVATLLSYYLINYFRHSLSKTGLLVAFLSLYWFLPSSLTGLTLLRFSQLYYLDSKIYEYGILLYGYILRALPVGLIIMLILSRHTYSNHLLKFLKIPAHRRFFTIILPIQWKKWLIIFGILFFLILNEITTTVLLVPPGFETIIVKIYNLMHYGDLETVTFLSLMQIILILAGLSFFILTRGLHDRA
jgi:iron(III) transport system permease protein